MEAKTKDAAKTKDVLKQLQTELKQLQNTVITLQRGDGPPGAEAGAAPPAAPKDKPDKDKPDKADAVVQYGVRPVEGGAPHKAGVLSFSEAHLQRVPDEAVAALGYALSSPQKVGLLRALLAATAGESAATLGGAAGLSTGSLYHHLHDLMHADLIGQAARNRYVLTERGRRALLVMLALAAQ